MRIGFENRLVLALFSACAFLLLAVCYANYIVPLFNYDFSSNAERTALSTLIVLYFALLIPRSKLKISSFYVELSLVLSILPMLVLYSEAGESPVFMLQALAAYALLFVFIRVGVSRVRIRPVPAVSSTTFLYGVLLCVALYIVSVVVLGGARSLNFDVIQVYSYRSESQELLPAFFGYISPTVREVLVPAVAVMAVHKRNWWALIAAFGMSLIVFGLTQDRGPLFYPFFALGAYTLARSRRGSLLMVGGYCFLIAVPTILGGVLGVGDAFGPGWIADLIVERGLFAPSNLNYMYYDYFSHHNFILWSNSGLTFGLARHAPDMSPAQLIGINYFDSFATFANTGWLGSGYMQGGWFGMVLYAAVISRVLRFLDGLARGADRDDRAALIGITVIPILSMLMSSDLPSTFLTGGLLWALLGASAIARKDRHGGMTGEVFKPALAVSGGQA